MKQFYGMPREGRSHAYNGWCRRRTGLREANESPAIEQTIGRVCSSPSKLRMYCTPHLCSLPWADALTCREHARATLQRRGRETKLTRSHIARKKIRASLRAPKFAHCRSLPRRLHPAAHSAASHSATTHPASCHTTAHDLVSTIKIM